eukprot:CAMPEP_0201728320 /NCGR_PEP_ID=MMETSP0593-20130828/15450_1 /ASSEMBLY_ACC=CAM_ASM_000672 /TAXON_ID=267983 /ORGANISM="Skeletonema japonicum, Strain CCMP2506" /LENGTH=370 /DNA_ID=CAMNT_0048220379 /DNA_START=242 /DNA_END=1351 /DNA_ORIENTATION=+
MPIASQLSELSPVNSPSRGAPPLQKFKSDTFIQNHASIRFRQITNQSNNNTPNDNDGDDHSYELRNINIYRRKVGEIVHDERFDVFILILIAINSVLYGVATFPSIKQNADLISDFEKVDLAILIVFTVESCMNIFYEGKRFVRDGWLIFDLLIVIVSWAATRFKSLQVFRIFRAFRFLTKVQILRNVVVALFSVVPAIAAITVLLLLILYIFSVMYTQLFKDYFEKGYTTADYFGTLDLTVFTLFQIMCLDEWSGIAFEVADHAYWAWPIFIVFVVMSAFVVVNLIIAVICDALQILRSAERAMLFGLSEDEVGEWPVKENKNSELVHTEEVRIQQRINDMNRMLDEVVASQERMNRTIQYLSIVVNSQ